MSVSSQYFWSFPSALTPKFCDEVIKYSKYAKDQKASVGHPQVQYKRKSNIVWLNDEWVYKEIVPYVNIANKSAGWNFHNKIRKLSVTCQLTDGSEYEGGELQFDYRDYDPHLREESKHVTTVKEILPKGSIIVFPSYVWHRVQPVTKGTRYSLVMWNLGYPFK